MKKANDNGEACGLRRMAGYNEAESKQAGRVRREKAKERKPLTLWCILRPIVLFLALYVLVTNFFS